MTVAQEVSAVTVSPPADTVAAVGDTVRLVAEATDANGHGVMGAEFSWLSSDTLVVGVDASGMVTAVGNGTARITATAGGASGTAAVTVIQSPDSVAVSPTEATIAALVDTLRLAAEAFDANGHAVAAAEFWWESGDAAVATVNGSGLVTGVGNGTATITARAGTASGSATVTVAQVVTAVTVTPVADTLTVGDTLRLQAEAFDANEHAIVDAEFSWESSDVSVAIVDSSGLVQALAEGKATVTASSSEVPGRAELVVATPIPSAERGVLEALFRATGGSGWVDAENWLTDAPLHDWHGVFVDDQGRVIGLDLTRNSLAGPIPSALAALAHLEWIRFGDNELTGLIPPALGRLANLRELVLVRNNLAGPIPPTLGDLTALRRLDLLGAGVTGPIPPSLGGLENLEELWLHGNRLAGSIPPELGDLGSLRLLTIGGTLPSDLVGSIPPELGRLANLEMLSLFWTGLTGPIPPELGSLHNLRILSLHSNDLTGPIPPELGDLANLRELRLSGNELTDPIPPELGRLATLEELALGWNNLAGPIPPELGDLARLRSLALNDNSLTGPIPPELGDLAALERLHLSANDLTGAVPPEFGGLISLRELLLRDNPDMSGPLPASLTRLTSLESMHTQGTGLCAPADAGFQAWLATVPNQRVAACGVESASFYLVQAVQSREFPVALVGGEEALLRVFVTAGRENDVDRPPVRASFYLDSVLAEVVDIPGGAGPVPTAPDESSLARTANAVIRAPLVQPGLEVVVEIDPDGTLPRELGITKRIPETGRAPVDVRAMPLLDLTLVPFLWTEDPDSAVLAAVDGMADDPEDHELLRQTHTLLPVVDLRLSAHEPVMSSSTDASDLLNQTHAIRVMEGGGGHYMGLMSGLSDAGIAHIAGRTSFSVPDSRIMAHELGHNLSLLHTAWPPPVDQTYPHAQGTIGAWGYSHDDEELVPPDWYDLMSYSFPGWISDYHYSKALRFRLADVGARGAATGSPGESLLLWGGVDAAGAPYLEPAFVVDAPITPPLAGGEYRIAGEDSEGRELFSTRFDMLEIADSEGSSSFALVVPADPSWTGVLASITLSGPAGSATLDGDTNQPMAILRSARTGQVRGILRDPSWPEHAATDGVGLGLAGGLDVLFSRGIPDGAAWRR